MQTKLEKLVQLAINNGIELSSTDTNQTKVSAKLKAANIDFKAIMDGTDEEQSPQITNTKLVLDELDSALLEQVGLPIAYDAIDGIATNGYGRLGITHYSTYAITDKPHLRAFTVTSQAFNKAFEEQSIGLINLTIEGNQPTFVSFLTTKQTDRLEMLKNKKADRVSHIAHTRNMRDRLVSSDASFADIEQVLNRS